MPNSLRIKDASKPSELQQLAYQGAGTEAARAILLSMESRKTLFRWLIGFAIGAAIYGVFVNL